VITLEKVTTEYIELEDRIRISAIASDDSIITLWASRRMLIRLIPPISDWLDETKRTSSQMNETSKQLMNDFAQSNAQAQLKPESPVNPDNYKSQIKTAVVNSWLIHEIDVKRSDQVMELCFKNGEHSNARLVLTKLFARQWLMILHSQWVKSEWPMNIWPEWFTKSSVQVPKDLH